MKHIITSFVLILSSIIFGQEVQTILKADSVNSVLQLNGVIGISSSGITNSFINRVYVDGFFTDEVKQDVENRLFNKSNRYQSLSQVNIYYATKEKKWNWSVGFNDVNSSSVTFSKNVFSVLMYGNKRFAGQNLDLDNTLLVSQRYQSLGFGINKEFNKWKIGAEVNILKGAYFDLFSLNNASLYTAPDGTEVKAKGDLKSINSESHRGKNFNGFGLSFNAQIKRQISEKISIELNANDIGFINWKDLNQVEGVLDKSLTPTEIDSALNLNTTDFTLAKLSGLEQRKTSFRYRTVGTVSVRTNAQLTDRLFARAGVILQTLKGALPLVYINPMYVMKNRHAIGVTLQAGGYSRRDIVVNYELKIKEKFNLGVNINALETLLSPKNTSSQGLNMYLISYF